jgi:hypothetical protein
VFEASVEEAGSHLPANSGKTPDLKMRKLDCAVVNAYLRFAERRGETYDTVRCGFSEGEPVYQGARIYSESHIQIAVRNQDCVLGVFRPKWVTDL